MDFVIQRYNHALHHKGFLSCYTSAWAYALETLPALRKCCKVCVQKAPRIDQKEPRLTNFVVVSKHVVVGTARAEVLEDGSCLVTQFTILPLVQNKGIGQALFAHLHAFALSNGCTRIWHDVYEANVPCVRLSEKVGYSVVERVQDDDHPWILYERLL